MKRVSFKTLFFIKRSRVGMDGKAPALLRVTVNGFRNETPVSIRIEPDKWNAFAEKSMGTTKKDQEMNARIDTIRLRIMQIHRQMELDGVEITPRKVLDEYLGRNEKSRVMLLVFLENIMNVVVN